MSFTTPRTWSAGELVTAGQLNTHIRDNENALLQATSTITTTGTQTALAIPGGAGGSHGDLVTFANNASLLTIQGMVAGFDGQRHTIFSIGAGQIDCAHQNGSAAAAMRLVNFVTSGLTSLAPGVGVASFIYDATAARWRLEYHEQGAWITPTFAAGNFTGSASMTWTVGSGDVNTCAYRLSGRTLTIAFDLSTTTVGGTPDADLRIGNGAWGSFTAAKQIDSQCAYQDNGANEATGRALVAAAGTFVLVRRGAGVGNWSAATDQTYTRGSITIEVT